MEEQSRIAQLEEELRLRRTQVEDLHARLGGAQPRAEESSQGGAAQQEVEALKVAVEGRNQEMSQMRQKLQQASQEKVEMMEAWKVPAALPPPAGGCRYCMASPRQPSPRAG